MERFDAQTNATYISAFRTYGGVVGTFSTNGQVARNGFNVDGEDVISVSETIVRHIVAARSDQFHGPMSVSELVAEILLAAREVIEGAAVLDEMNRNSVATIKDSSGDVVSHRGTERYR
ncbi:MAG: hypothetical protein LBB18_04465 [Puniceicoccales bacterium]|jgi:hypothetical protein|nr:hypothetical protein [Puniceicoccales bacterium]